MLLPLLSVLSVCSALNVRFEDTEGRPLRPVHREEHIHKNIDGRMEQLAARPGADGPGRGNTGQGREVHIRYIVNPPVGGLVDHNIYDNNSDAEDNRRLDTNTDSVYPQSQGFSTKADAVNINVQAYTNQNERTERPEYATDNLQNDQPIQSYTSRPNFSVSSENFMAVSSSTTPNSPEQRSSLNNQRRKNINNSTSQRSNTTKKFNERKVTHSTTEMFNTRSTVKDVEYSKSTRDNEVTPQPHTNKKDQEDEPDRWVWMNGEKGEKARAPAPTNVTFVDRASFTGDSCPTGKVRFNGKCVDAD